MQSAVLLDKHPLWLEAVEQVLGRVDINVVGKATAPTRALELIDEFMPELFVTGVHMGEGEIDGITCIATARERLPHLRAVVLSGETSTDYIDRALEVGAVAYVFKSAYPDDLASAVRQVFGTRVYFAGTRPGHDDASQRRSTRDARSDPARAGDPPARRRGALNANSGQDALGDRADDQVPPVDIYRKLDVSNRTEAARWAQLHGLLDRAVPGGRRSARARRRPLEGWRRAWRVFLVRSARRARALLATRC